MNVSVILIKPTMFQDYNKLKAIRSWDPTTPGLNCNATAEKAVKEWAQLQERISF